MLSYITCVCLANRMFEDSALVLQLTSAEHLVRGDDVPCAVLAAGLVY